MYIITTIMYIESEPAIQARASVSGNPCLEEKKKVLSAALL